MLEVVLIVAAPDGSGEIRIEREKTSFGRGSEADHHFADDGLSRLHATIYREEGRVWIVDENSTNGSFVNGARVDPGGTPLREGDVIKIGNSTTLNVRISSVAAAESPTPADPHTEAAQSGAIIASDESASYLIPVTVIAAAVMIIGISAVFIGINIFGGDQQRIEPTTEKRNRGAETATEKSPANTSAEIPVRVANHNENTPEDLTIAPDGDAQDDATIPKGKTYSELSDAEKLNYVEVKAMKVARMIGNRSADPIPADAANVIRKDVDAYLRRIGGKRSDGACRMGGNLEQTYERASRNAPFIIRSFYSQGLDPQIGIYLAMIESEHCNCLQSPSGPLGMFQFARAAARENGLNVKDNASPSNPDERCEPEPASLAAAKYMKTLSGRFGTGPLSIPLAIASYNSGQGALSNNLEKALEAGGNQQRSFWTLVAKAENLSKQFKDENIRYVPKFFAAAIIGENPQDFGLNLQPLSTYTK